MSAESELDVLQAELRDGINQLMEEYVECIPAEQFIEVGLATWAAGLVGFMARTGETPVKVFDAITRAMNAPNVLHRHGVN